jgi:hypothetical protein
MLSLSSSSCKKYTKLQRLELFLPSRRSIKPPVGSIPGQRTAYVSHFYVKTESEILHFFTET